MTINEIQDQIIEDFSYYEDWMDKYEYIIQLGKELPPIDEEYRKEEYLIRGCQAKVWLHAAYVDGKVIFTADSDAYIPKGLIALMINVLSNQPAREIATADIYFIDKIGLESHLMQTRGNGLLAMLKQMKLYALALNAAHSS